MTARADKIAKLAGLLSGTISKEDFKPKNYSILIGWGEIDGVDHNLYLIDGVVVDRQQWEKINPPILSDGFEIEYGGGEDAQN